MNFLFGFILTFFSEPLQANGLDPALYYPLRRAFVRADRDRSGSLSARELRTFLRLGSEVTDVRHPLVCVCRVCIHVSVCVCLSLG